ncbi:MAG: TlpA family protein disulfide reductase [Deltaproteobacteria bacterium]|nr:TlpA family protein disulfide reductase [Deltaproteobacteria bacterium]
MVGNRRRDILLSFTGFGLLACASPPSERAAVPTPPALDEPAKDEAVLPVVVVDSDGTPLPGVVVGVRGGYDVRARSVGETNAQGRVELSVEGLTVAFVTVGPSARAIIHYGSAATKDTVVVLVDPQTELTVTHRQHGSSADPATTLQQWPVHRSNQRILGYIDVLLEAATSDPSRLVTLVDAQWTEIDKEPDPRLRKLLAIHYATFAAQAVGPKRFASLLDMVEPADKAWIVQSTYVLELLWVMDDDAWRQTLIEGLRTHHADPGLEAAIASWALTQADDGGHADTVLALYRELEDPKYAPTIAWRNARKYDPERKIAAGRAMPPFSGLRTDEPPATLSEADLAGKAWVIHVWATWCSPCVEELRALPGLYQQLADHRDDVEFLAVSVDEQRELTTRTLAEHAVTWPSIWIPDAEMMRRQWGFSGVPVTLLVDASGTIVKVWDRAASMPSLERAVRSLVDPSSPAL